MQDMHDLTDCAAIEDEDEKKREEEEKSNELDARKLRRHSISKTMRVHTLEGIVSRENLNNRYVFIGIGIFILIYL
jgi:hypothetical protein